MNKLAVAAGVDFTDVAPQRLSAVRFDFRVHDTFDAVTETLGLDWLGTFSPGVQIHARSNLAGTIGVAEDRKLPAPLRS